MIERSITMLYTTRIGINSKQMPSRDSYAPSTQVDGRNAILIVINRLSKKRYYIAYTASKEGTLAEATTRLLIEGVFRLYSLSDSIVLNRRP